MISWLQKNHHQIVFVPALISQGLVLEVFVYYVYNLLVRINVHHIILIQRFFSNKNMTCLTTRVIGNNGFVPSLPVSKDSLGPSIYNLTFYPIACQHTLWELLKGF